jgi:NAD(P)-dependent dehydrogenase (short-subunit alcohol dehydrogenase family)
MAGRLAAQTALVMGAGQTPGDTLGNGRATALRFAQEGATVVCADHRVDSAEETVEMIRASGGEASSIEVEVTDEASVAAAIDASARRLGRIDILHNNVGIGSGDAGATSITEAALDHILDVNLKGAVFACKHVLPLMRDAGSGVILNLSSIAAVCSVDIVAYKSSKAALNAYTQAVAVANAPYGIRANSIMPGLINTPMAIETYVAAGFDRDELIQARDRLVPLEGGQGDAWDIANAALFLASDEARFITGVSLAVDGGQSARVG